MRSRGAILGWLISPAVILVVALGWKLHQTTSALMRAETEIQSLRVEVTQAVKLRERALVKLRSIEMVRPAGTAAEPPGADFTVRSPMETLNWLKARDEHLSTVAFHAVDGVYGFDIQMAILLGLKPEEYDRLNAAIRKTQQSLNDLSIQAASAHPSPDGKTLEVSVPSLTSGSDALYSNLLNTFAQVLGPDRFQVFNTLAGEDFDNSFGRFGLDPVRYVLTLRPTDQPGGPPRYPVKRYFTNANGNGYGWDNNAYTLSDLQEGYPVLAHFLPPALAQQAASGGNK